MEEAGRRLTDLGSLPQKCNENKNAQGFQFDNVNQSHSLTVLSPQTGRIIF